MPECALWERFPNISIELHSKGQRKMDKIAT